MKLDNCNAMPAPTWSWLKMNKTAFEIADDLELAGRDAIEVEGAADCTGAAGDFAAALDDAARRYTHRRKSAPGDAADIARVAESDEDALDVPALSSYQTEAVRLEEDCGPAESFSHGTGAGIADYLVKAAGAPVVIKLDTYQKADVTVRVNGKDDAVAAANIQVVVAPHAELSLTIALDSPEAGTGAVGSLLSVVAGEQAHIDVVCIQTLDDGYKALDASGFFLDEWARVNVRQTVLGAGAAYTGLASELWGDTSKIEVDTSYLGAREQVRDFNYSIRHLGRKTQSNMDASGVLTGTSAKVLRGTIDLVHGCKGSEGTERETVLIANKGVDNKTVPVILCDEDDVAGNHGATIGHVRDEQLFYMACRGLSPDAAENLFVRAKLEDAALSATDERIRASVCRLGGKLVKDFEEDLV